MHAASRWVVVRRPAVVRLRGADPRTLCVSQELHASDSRHRCNVSAVFPPLSSKLVVRWMLVTLAASVIAALDGGWLAHWTALAPSRIWQGEVWRVFTWPFVEPGPVSLLLTCASIYKFGGELAAVWGDRRLRRFVTEVVLAAAAVTCVLAPLAGGAHLWRVGGWAIADTLVIAWARQFPARTLVLYGLVALRGRELVTITVAINVIYALYLGPISLAPELLACLLAAAYPGTRLRG